LKPLKLTEYLATLLIPPDAYKPRRILVPFAGAASEMIGALQAGWDEIVGIEQDAGYCEIGRARLAHYEKLKARPGWAAARKKQKPKSDGAKPSGLFDKMGLQ